VAAAAPGGVREAPSRRNLLITIESHHHTQPQHTRLTTAQPALAEPAATDAAAAPAADSSSSSLAASSSSDGGAFEGFLDNDYSVVVPTSYTYFETQIPVVGEWLAIGRFVLCAIMPVFQAGLFQLVWAFDRSTSHHGR